MGKSTISMAIFNSYVCLPEGMILDDMSMATVIHVNTFAIMMNHD